MGNTMDYHFTKGQFDEAELESAIIELFKEQSHRIKLLNRYNLKFLN